MKPHSRYKTEMFEANAFWGPPTLSESENENFFLRILLLLHVNNTLNFLRTHLEAASLSHSLSLRVNGP